MKKLNTKGFSHILFPLLIIGVIAAIGTYVLTASHADTPGANTAAKTVPVQTPDPHWSAAQAISAGGITDKSPGVNGSTGTVALTYHYFLKPGQTASSGNWGTLTGRFSGSQNSWATGSYFGNGRMNGFQSGSSGPTAVTQPYQMLFQTNYYAATPSYPASTAIAIYCGNAQSGNDTGVLHSSGAVTLNPAVTVAPDNSVSVFTNINGKFVSFRATQPCNDTWTGPSTITSNVMANTAPAAIRIGTGQVAAAYLNKNNKVEAYLSGAKWAHVNTLVNKTGYTVVGSPALVSTGGNAVKLMVMAQSATGQPSVLLQADSPDITKYGLSTLSLAQTNLPATNQLIQPVNIGDGYIHLYVTDQVKGTIYQVNDKL